MAVRKKYRTNYESKASLYRDSRPGTSQAGGGLEGLRGKSGLYRKKRGITSSLSSIANWIAHGRNNGGKTGFRSNKGRINWHHLLSVFLRGAAVLAIVGFFVAIAAFIYFSKDIPDPAKIADRSVEQSTQIYDRTGTVLLYQIHGDEKRTAVKLDQVSPNLVHAVVATEDKKFYKHHGIDLKGIARAIYKDVVRGEKAQGASTITQQLVKLSMLSSEKSFTRKIKEIILALETEQKFSKDQIMEMYLNQVPYGSNLYGAEVASQTFFGKSAKDLDLAEAAMLAAIPQSSTYYFPYGSHPDALEARRKYVIKEMLEDGYISQEEADAAKAANVFERLKPFVSEIKAPHFVMYIKDQLVNEYGQDTVEKGGLKVYTTLDYGLQEIAEDAVKKGAESNAAKYNATNAALVATDPKTGQILAMVGGKDYFDIKNQGNVNVAISENRQPGSSFKPFVYATAFKKGYTPNTILFDVPTNFGPDGTGKDFEPKNYNLQYSGPVTVRSALARSLNIPAVKALYLAGIDNSIQTAHDMGITTLNSNNYGLSLVLGTGGVKLLDITGAYGVFANEGKRNDATGILKIEDAKGNVIKEYKDNPKQVIDAEVARNITSILSDNAARTPTFGANSKLYFRNRPVAAKTGTTSDYKDAWTVGYTPSISVGVWAGNNSGKAMTQGGGVSAATPIWNDFLTRALSGKPVEQFTAPQPITTKKAVLNGSATADVTVTIDKACGDKLATENTPEDQKEQLVFREVHSILYYVNKDDPQGDYPKKPQEDQQFSRWESGVLAWAQANMGSEINQNAPTETCDLRGNGNSPKVQIESPHDDQIIKNGTLNISADASSSSYGIKQVEFYLDNSLLKIFNNSPYSGTFRLEGDIEEGVHTVKVKAYDDIGNVGAAQVSVIIGNASGSETSLYLKPISGADFPLALEAAAAVSGSVKKVEFYYQLDSIFDSDGNLVKKPGASYKIGESQSPAPGSSSLYQILWEEDRNYFISGRYKIYAILTAGSKRYRSNERYVDIR